MSCDVFVIDCNVYSMSFDVCVKGCDVYSMSCVFVCAIACEV